MSVEPRLRKTCSKRWNNHRRQFLILRHPCQSLLLKWHRGTESHHSPQPAYHAIVMWKDSQGKLSFLLSHWFVPVHPKPRMCVFFLTKFLHTHLPYFHYPCLFPCLHLIHRAVQFCRKQVYPDPLCGTLNGLGKKLHPGTHEHTLPPLPPTSLPQVNKSSPGLPETQALTPLLLDWISSPIILVTCWGSEENITDS